MKQFIYQSDFKAGPEATKKQNKLFNADLEFAMDEGYEFIKTSDGVTFQIVDPDNIIEVDVTEEDLQNLDQAMDKLNETVDELLEDSEEICTECHNLMLIDGILNNTLSKKEDITPQQADTMIKLAQLKHLLQGTI